MLMACFRSCVVRLFMTWITECFIISCCLITWLINYFLLSALKLAVCHRSGGNGLDWGGMSWTGLNWVGSWKLDPRTTVWWLSRPRTDYELCPFNAVHFSTMGLNGKSPASQFTSYCASTQLIVWPAVESFFTNKWFCHVKVDWSGRGLKCRLGGVAQWLGCRSVAGGLSLICAWSMVDVWPLCG